MGREEFLEERDGPGVLAFLLGAQCDPKLGIDGLRLLGIFGNDFLVGRDGVVPFPGVLVERGDSDLGGDGFLGARAFREEVAECREGLVGLPEPAEGGGLVDHGESGEASVGVERE